jgi:tRNA pseudouridine38-40 synthase
VTRYAFGIEYDGSEFKGWQRQTQEPHTVQAAVEDALSKVADHPVAVTCAGRTDTGVHATGQVIHFDTEAKRDLRGWLFGTNSNLPPAVSAIWVKQMPETFHARFKASARQYRYVILNRDIRPALGRAALTWVHWPLDAARMQAAAQQLTGKHDFSAFRSSDCQAKQPVRDLKRLDVRREGERIVIDAVADGFLHHMVRNISGVLLEIGQGKRDPTWAREVLDGRDRNLGGVTAPAYGLTLVAVEYPAEFAVPVSRDALF